MPRTLAFAAGNAGNWRTDQEAEIIATGISPTNDLESAIDATLAPGTYTAIVRGKNNTSGVALIEVYDLNQGVDSKLANISTRGLVQTGNDVLIGGLIVLGQDPLRVIVRAIGPSIGVAGALADPTLELHDINGTLIMANNNWQDSQAIEIQQSGLAPAAIVSGLYRHVWGELKLPAPVNTATSATTARTAETPASVSGSKGWTP